MNWDDFFNKYSDVIFKSIYFLEQKYGVELLFEADECKEHPDVIEILKNKYKKIIKKYKEESGFETYLRKTIKNIAIDVIRQKKGRLHIPKKVEGLGETACKVFELYFIKGYKYWECYQILITDNNARDLTYAGFLEIVRDLNNVLSDNWKEKLLRRRIEKMPEKLLYDASGKSIDISDTSQSPEVILARKEYSINKDKVVKYINEAMRRMSGEQVLVLRLHVIEGLPFTNIDKILKITNAGDIFNDAVVFFRQILNRYGLSDDDIKNLMIDEGEGNGL